MRQASFNRKKARDDDKLPAFTKPFQRLATDHMIHNRRKGDTVDTYDSFTIRDQYSGVGLALPRKTKSTPSNVIDMRHFVGPNADPKNKPTVMVKSDNAQELTGAVDLLGWLREQSLSNKFPHNAEHERWIGTLKTRIVNMY